MLTHVDSKNKPTMVNVGEKVATYRTATARSVIRLPESISSLFCDGEISGPKGPVFATAVIAGTMAVKKTSELIPFCHPLPIDGCHLNIRMEGQNDVFIDCQVNTYHKTGVEMEALTGASVAALTIYDMCKAMSHEIQIVNTGLLSKSGGKCDYVSSV